MRLVHLDEIIFQNQRFFFRPRDNSVEVANQLRHLTRERRMPGVLGKIRAHTAFQRARFADVNYFAFRVFVQINAWRIGQGINFIFEGIFGRNWRVGRHNESLALD